MDAVEMLTGRRSVRRFGDRPVAPETLEEIVSLARFAPSWKNTQTARYYAVLDAALRERIAEEAVMGFEGNRNVILGAPALVLLTTVEGRSGYERDGTPSTDKGAHWQSFDAGAAAQTFCLAAYRLGLGTVIMGIYEEEALRRIIPIREGESVSALIAMGYPADAPRAPKRKEVGELLTFLPSAGE